ncbi:MAG TPA: HAD family hydrolase [Terriglobales bacterium]|nr:HAD family hydrolase [Terriglobales bacterium]
MPTFQCSAILFDLDGVLVDSTASVSRQWRRWAEENGVDPELAVSLTHGVRTIDTVRLVAPHLDAEAETRKIEEREATDSQGVLIMPGAAELLRSLPPERWCIVTSGTRRVASSRLVAGKLPVPQVIVTGNDVSRGKPDPEPYLTGAELLGMKPSECLVIEDAPAGIRAAHAGGMKVIALLTTYPAAELKEADAVVKALAEIRVESYGTGLRVEI